MQSLVYGIFFRGEAEDNLFSVWDIFWRRICINYKQLMMSSQLDEPLWDDPGVKSGIGVWELIST